MKKITKITAAFLFTIGFAGMASAQSAYTVKSSGGANLRQGPATGKEVLTTMPAGAKVKVVEKTNEDWYKVEYNGKSGYVSSSLIEDKTNNSSSGDSNSSGNTSKNNMAAAQNEQKKLL